MTAKRRQGYKPPRDPREIFIAIVAALAVVMIAAVLIWVFQPGDDSGTTTTDVPTSNETPPASSPAPTTVPTPATSATTPSTTAPPSTSTP
jgi:hypothetical protein